MLGPSFTRELQEEERATGLKLLVPGVSWGDPRYREAGLDPLPDNLTTEQVTAIQDVVAAHDPTKQDPVAVNADLQAQINALEQRQGRALREAAIGRADAVGRLMALDVEIATLRAKFMV